MKASAECLHIWLKTVYPKDLLVLPSRSELPRNGVAFPNGRPQQLRLTEKMLWALGSE